MYIEIDVRNRMIRIRERMTVLDAYRYLQTKFDDEEFMPFPIPMSRTGGQKLSSGESLSAIYKVNSTWTLDKESFKYLRDGTLLVNSAMYSFFVPVDKEVPQTLEEMSMGVTVLFDTPGLRLIRV